MTWRLTEEQQMIQLMVRGFTRSKIEPIAAELDREGRFPAEILSQIGKERAFCRFLIPHEKAGAIRSIFHSGYICEKSYKPEGVYISAEVSHEIKGQLGEFLI